jgi:hypothetical protein
VQLQRALQEDSAVPGREGERIQSVHKVACLGRALLRMGHHKGSLPYWSTSCKYPSNCMLNAQCTRHCRAVSFQCRKGRALGQGDLQAQGFQDSAHDREPSLGFPPEYLAGRCCMCLPKAGRDQVPGVPPAALAGQEQRRVDRSGHPGKGPGCMQWWQQSPAAKEVQGWHRTRWQKAGGTGTSVQWTPASVGETTY